MHRDLALPFGFELEIDKGIPLSSGMGGSAASCVAALLAANALLDEPLRREHLYRYALDGEAVASGSRHGDNLDPYFWAASSCVPWNAWCRWPYRLPGTACLSIQIPC